MPSMMWEPFHELVRLRERMNRLLEEMTARAQGKRLVFGAWTPPMDIFEYGECFVLHAELPGMKRDDISIQIDGDTMVLKGERRPSARRARESFHQIEITYGAFRREFALPKDVLIDAVKASYRKGVLTVNLPKVEASIPTTIKVQSSR